MNNAEFFQKTDLNNSFVIGYYGGGNFGDELLLETIIILFTQFQFKNIKIAHLFNANFRNWHKISKDFSIIDYKNKIMIFINILKSKNIVVGGGGLWGLEVNINTLVMSVVLFFCKFILRKRVYMLGVGYYNSTNLLGRVSACFAGRSADLIITRDNESCNNFKKLNKNTFLDFDLAFNLENVDLSDYKNDVESLTRKIRLFDMNVFFSIRGINEFSKNIIQVVRDNPTINFVLLDFSNCKECNKTIDTFNETQKMCYDIPNLSFYSFDYNPVALFLFFKEKADKLFMISPQYHGQVVAYLAGVKFMPISYDNKNTELFGMIDIINFFNMQLVGVGDIQNEINSYINR